ncbi:MAG: TonB-dependent receptor, partial [Rubrivivax sp.]
ASLRRDDDSQFGGRTTGNLALGAHLTPTLRLSAGTGTAFKAPSFNDLYYPGFSNPDLRPETSRGAELAAHWDDGLASIGLTLFQNRIRDLIQYDFVSSMPQNVARARNRGATLAAGWRGPHWQAAAEWTWQDPVDTETGARLPRRARRHGTASLDWTPGGAWSAGADLVVSGERVDNSFEPPPPRLDAYTLLHLRAGVALAPQWRLALHLYNATDEAYALVQGYNTAGRQLVIALEYRAP